MQDSSSELKEVIYNLVQIIAAKPSAVMVSDTFNCGVHNVTVYVDEEDFAHLAEHNARTLRALETVVVALARKHKTDATLEIIGRSDKGTIN